MQYPLKTKNFQMTQGGYQVIIILPIKSKMAAAKKRWFLRFLYFTESSPPSFKVRGLQMTMNLALVWVHISNRHSNLNFAHQFVNYWLFQHGANKNQHQDSYQRETVSDKFIFFSKLVRQKKSIGRAKYVYVCEWDMCWRNFCNFLWWLKHVKSRSKIALFQMIAILKFDFQKREQLRFFEVNYLNYTKKTQFCMWQLHFP